MTSGKKLIPSRELALALLYVLTGSAGVNYPTSTRAHPSSQVRVSQQKSGPLPGMAQGILPLQMREKIWRFVAVPVLKLPVWEAAGIVEGRIFPQRKALEILGMLQLSIEQFYSISGLAP